MIQQMYSTYDVKTERYDAPIASVNTPTAMRLFSQLWKSERSMVCRFPEDYKLFEVGTFNDGTGVITSCKTPVFICNAVDLIGTVKLQETENAGNK